MRRIVIHIGLSKAASTSLQSALASSRDDLSAIGAEYPMLGGRGVKDQKPVWQALSGRPEARAAVRASLAASAAETVIFSGETLLKFDPAVLREVLAGTPFARAEVTSIAIVREPARWLNSRYAWRTINFGHSERFAAFVRSELRIADFATMFEPWRARTRFVAVPLEHRTDPRPVLTRAFEAMGLAVAPPPEEPRKPAPDPRTVEVGRRVAAAVARVDEGRQPPRRKLLDAAAAQGWRDRFSALDPRLTREIYAATQLSRETFARSVFGLGWDEVFAVPHPDAFVSNEWSGGAEEGEIARLAAEIAAMLPAPRKSVFGWLAGRRGRAG